jgi:predicted site-specific integrase-resolvase
MTIKEVCEKFDITPNTLRYYERVGVIPDYAVVGGVPAKVIKMLNPEEMKENMI